MHPLDNVIWNALTTRQAHFAEGSGNARKFVREVSPLAAFREDNAAGYESLAALVAPKITVGIFIDRPYEAQPGWEYVAGAPLVQMVCGNGLAAGGVTAAVEIAELGEKDVTEMLELTALTKPGPFDKRTHKFGRYAGIRVHGSLAAMAGERMKVPGHTEVSAVCTHPEHTGKGYAAILMVDVMKGIRQRGEIPFLHVRQDNLRAIELYKRLGFHERVLRHYAVLRRT